METNIRFNIGKLQFLSPIIASNLQTTLKLSELINLQKGLSFDYDKERAEIIKELATLNECVDSLTPKE